MRKGQRLNRRQSTRYWLLLAYAAAGVETPRALLLLQLGQSILGGVLVLGIMKLAGLVAPERLGLARVAGLVSAIHPTLIYAATHIQVALLGTTLFVWTLALAYQTGATRRTRDAVATGVILAALTLTDPILVLAAAGVAWALLRLGLTMSDGCNRSGCSWSSRSR